MLQGAKDNVFIMYHGKVDNYPIMVTPDKWVHFQSSGEIADGVVVIEGGREGGRRRHTTAANGTGRDESKGMKAKG